MTEIWKMNEEDCGFNENRGFPPLSIFVESSQEKRIHLIIDREIIIVTFGKEVNQENVRIVTREICKILNTEKIEAKTILNILIESALKNVEVQEQIKNNKIGRYEVKSEDFLKKDFRKNA